jgi:predicted nucleotidyltransferase
MNARRPPSPAIGEVLERILAEDAPAGVVSVYLFGSQVAGRGHRESDVDVGVLLSWSAFPNAADRFETRLSLSGLFGRALGGATWTSSS